MARQWKIRLTASFLLALTLFAVSEVFLRITGFSHWQNKGHKVKTINDKKLFQSHPKLGYTGNTGTFHIIQDEALRFTVTHNHDGYRITSATQTTGNKPEIWVLGCSFTHGWGVNDDESFPYLLQEHFSAYTVRNYGMSGYSTVHAYLQLDSLLKIKTPALIILNYASFHNQRNVADRFWRKAFSTQQVVNGFTYPYAQIESDTLTIKQYSLPHPQFPGIKWSATLNFIDNWIGHYEKRRLREVAVTKRLLNNIITLAKNNNTPLLISNIYHYPFYTEYISGLQQPGVVTKDISLDFSLAKNSLLPLDPHPSPHAHRQFADQLTHTIDTLILTLNNNK